MRCKEKDIIIKMVNNFRDCDENWRGRSELQSNWDKKYILKYKPYGSNYTSIMKFRYLEDYKKMKKINGLLDGILVKMYNSNHLSFTLHEIKKIIFELEEETVCLLNFIKKMQFFKC